MAVVLQLRFRRSGSPADGAGALAAARQAATAEDHHVLFRAGSVLRDHAAETGDAALAAEAVAVARRGLAAGSETDSLRPQLLHLLSTALDDPTEALEASRLAIEAATPPRRGVTHQIPAGGLQRANLADMHCHRGRLLQAQHERTADPDALREARSHFWSAANAADASIFQKIEATVLQCALPDPDASDDAFMREGMNWFDLVGLQRTLGLLAALVPGALTRPDQEYWLERLPSAAAVAAALALEADQPEKAVELLEQTRGILVADALDARSSDAARLAAADPALAAEFAQVRARREALERAGSPAPARQEAEEQWQELLALIRTFDGFHDFQRAPVAQQLTAHADQGPIVFVYAATVRCDALILTGDATEPVLVVPLDALTLGDAETRAAELTELIQAAADSATTGNGMLIVAAPDAPAVGKLPSAAREAAAVNRLLPQALCPPRPTRGSVLKVLPEQVLVHFACHGIADPRNPADSHLVLYDEPADPLTVGDISGLRVSAELAYLSACDTTVTTASLSNEAVHLTGAFHLAGYRHVIGSLWQVGDSAARQVATDFYDRLTAGGTTAQDTSRSAHALHEAVLRLRARFPDTPTLWAAHHHTGV